MADNEIQPLDVRLLIISHPIDLFQAWVLIPGTSRGWLKSYQSKIECIADLCLINLLTASDVIIAHAFDTRDETFSMETSTDSWTLAEAGFSDRTRENDS